MRPEGVSRSADAAHPASYAAYLRERHAMKIAAALLAAGLLTLTGCGADEPTTPDEVIAALNTGGFDCEPMSASGMGAVGDAKFCAPPGPVVEGAENYVTVTDDPAGTETLLT